MEYTKLMPGYYGKLDLSTGIDVVDYKYSIQSTFSIFIILIIFVFY